MTLPARPALPPPDPAKERQQTLDELRDTPDREVGQASQDVSGISPEEEQGRRRKHRTDEDKAWADMRVICIRWLGYVIVAGGVLVAIGALVAAGFWLVDQIKEPAKLDELMGKVVVAIVAFLGSRVFRQTKPSSDE
ncbi:MAG: hypothetical protein PGN16_08460 [Sphingomonas phyllosphaerae]|uniref:hypothetical protein n=1 Tax=Sphingomonas phyllosphaerae TaxID=257003 RepID=UPI002FF72673